MLSPPRLALAALLLATFVLPTAAPAADLFVNPGVKIGWTFGRGLTYGLELSFVWDVQSEWAERDFTSLPYGHGLVFDVDTNFKGFWKAHAGYEAIGPFIGIDVGPTLVGDQGRVLFGLGITPWAGYDVIPYYTYTLAFGGEKNFHEMGTYLKVAIAPDDDGKVQSGSSWHD
jgi:hypothetical protein